jgi:type I restriction enzyme M protein
VADARRLVDKLWAYWDVKANVLFSTGSPHELVARDKANLDITWLKDESLDDLDNLPSPDVIAREIVEDLTAALAEFEAVAAALEVQLTSAELDPATTDPQT